MASEPPSVALAVDTGDDFNDIDFDFPIKSKDDLDQFESRLKSEPTFRNQMVSFIIAYL